MIKPAALAVSAAGTVTTTIYFLPEKEEESVVIVSETHPTFPPQNCGYQVVFEDFLPIPVGAFVVPLGILLLLCWLLHK